MYPENELNPNGLDLKKSIFISINHYNHAKLMNLPYREELPLWNVSDDRL
jgi:hypothetical protein